MDIEDASISTDVRFHATSVDVRAPGARATVR